MLKILMDLGLKAQYAEIFHYEERGSIMIITHSYLASQLRPFLALAEQMEDALPSYALAMIIEHCDDVTLNKTKPIVIAARQNYQSISATDRLI